MKNEATKAAETEKRHIIEIGRNGWGLEHPRWCREDGRSLLDCYWHEVISASARQWDGPPEPFGRYVVEIDDGEPTLIPVELDWDLET